MSVNLEVKGTLSRLLATEDLLVEHKSVSTASFNVRTRVLTLPRWEKASNSVLNLLISHEVGHALFTPDVDFRKRTEVPMGFINVTEDVRIEHLMKQKYSGLPKTFYRGYQELHDQDFFGIEDSDVSEMNIADRVNLHFKIGNFIKVPFTDEEMVVVKQCAAARTFDDAIAAAEALYALHEKQKEEQQTENVSVSPDSDEDPSSGESESEDVERQENDGQNQEGEGGEGNEPQDGEDKKEGESDNIEETEEKNVGGDTAGNLSDDVTTMDNFSENLEDLNNDSSFSDPVYITYPKIDTSRVIASNKEIHEYIHSEWNELIARWTEYSTTVDTLVQRSFGCHRDDFANFRRSIQSEVNYMVKEFECKKSAAAYSRATTSRTGVLDCTKLHTYKYNEDLFKKVTSLPQGKNHGLIFVLDWSGSMCEILHDTMKQLLSLVMFCDKLNIPFDVYAFTNEWNYGKNIKTPIDNANEFHIGGEFSMMNILTSKVRRKELIKQMETMYVIARSYSHRLYDIVPPRVGLSGTPLNEALITMRHILPEFKEANGVEKAHVMVLTDGEASFPRVTREYDDYNGESKLLVGRFHPHNTYIRNRKTGTVRTPGRNLNENLTSILLQDLRSEFTESTFTGFRILENRGGWFVRQACNYNDKMLANWKKEKSIALSNFGYDKYYIVSSNAIQESSEFNVDEGATKAKIKSAFAKSLKGKKNNKRILADFIGLIA